MRIYSMEYYMMNDATVFCPEWSRPEEMTGADYKDGSKKSLLGRIISELFG